jgi:DHA2 family multidrug resistance protein
VLEEGTRKDWFADEAMRWFALASVSGALVFFWRSLTYRNPIVDLKAFRNRNFATGCLFSLTIGVGLYGLVYLLPLYLGRVQGLNSLQIGEIMFITALPSSAQRRWPVSSLANRPIRARCWPSASRCWPLAPG